MVSEEWGAWLLVTPVYPLRRGHDEYPVVAADPRRASWVRVQGPWAAGAAELSRSAWPCLRRGEVPRSLRTGRRVPADARLRGRQPPWPRHGAHGPRAAADHTRGVARRGQASPSAAVGAGPPVATAPPDPPRATTAVLGRGVQGTGAAKPNASSQQTGRASRSPGQRGGPARPTAELRVRRRGERPAPKGGPMGPKGRGR